MREALTPTMAARFTGAPVRALHVQAQWALRNARSLSAGGEWRSNQIKFDITKADVSAIKRGNALLPTL